MTVDLDLQLAYALMVLLGVALLLVFRPAAAYASSERRQYWQLQGYTMLGAIFGAKLVVLMGDAEWPLKPYDDWLGLVTSGRSIVGALLFGFLVAEALKPVLGYKLPPNDKFAMILPFSIATGRLGCWLSGCCLGIPMEGPLAVAGLDGVPRFPAPLVEMAFHVAAGLALIALWRRKILVGRLFALYLVAYGIFRFASEYWRETPKGFAGYSAYQWFCIAMIVCGGMALYLRRERGQSPFLQPELTHGG
ncbi:MAG: prolipoprotein diacylglyceryl transferase [Pseudomonadota bacterium]|nr:prolipoprotein diacylglyceryl transferase [Pseudomonadota bacterium]